MELKARSFEEHMSEKRIAQMLDYLAATDERCASLKANVARTEYLAKLQEAMAYKAIDNGSIEDRKAEAKMSPTVQKAWDGHFKAVAAYEKVRARRGHAMTLTELWRSWNANRRQGQV